MMTPSTPDPIPASVTEVVRSLAAATTNLTSADLRRLRAKSVALTGFLQDSIDALPAGLIEVITPAPAAERGCQLSLRLLRPAHAAKRCHEVLTAAGVIGDWREPDILRLAPTPLYNSFGDVAKAVSVLADALA